VTDVRLPRGQPALIAAVNATPLISRDGGPFEETAQPVEGRAYGITFFLLTAKEMEAEYIVIPATPLVTIRTEPLAQAPLPESPKAR
jgi:hypothetical protein